MPVVIWNSSFPRLREHGIFAAMSIVTKTGDNGTTALMYGRRVSKSHPRVEAYGTVDELNAALGLARASATHDFLRTNLLVIQQDLVTLMGELATGAEDLPRYAGSFDLTSLRWRSRVSARWDWCRP